MRIVTDEMAGRVYAHLKVQAAGRYMEVDINKGQLLLLMQDIAAALLRMESK